MRILHTADWHFGRTLEGRDRIPEQRQFVDELCRLCDDERVDVVLMAGDVYQSVNPSAEAEALFYDALQRLSRGGSRAIVAIAGNHDSPERLAAPSPLADKLGITLIGLPTAPILPTTTARTGSVFRPACGPSWLELALPNRSEHMIVAALPYPSEARLNALMADSLEEVDMQAGYNQHVSQILSHLAQRFREDTVNVTMTHLYVRGGIESDSEVQIQVGGAYAVDPATFPVQSDYVALGHLHRPQVVPHDTLPIRYAGSPLMYSFSEAGYAKSVVLLDAVPGRHPQITEIPLSSGRPLVRWRAEHGLAQVAEWVNDGKDANAWIDLELHLEEPLGLHDIQRLRAMHAGIVQIRPVLPEISHRTVEETRSLPLDELFVRFAESRLGYIPDDRLVQLFLELASSVDENGEVAAE